MHLFLDTNILLDIIEARPDFIENSTNVLTIAEKMDARIFIAWHGLATIYYLIRSGRTEAAAMHEIDGILGWAEIAQLIPAPHPEPEVLICPTLKTRCSAQAPKIVLLTSL